LPGLDGLRALAVAAVVAYHLGYGWAQGGLLGVGVFFTLSGYLITDILVGQWAAHGRIRLADFWLRRARRLLPALFVMLAVVTIWVNGFTRSFLPGFRGDVVASVLYVSNWWFIGQHSSYYARFAPPAPLDHLWSLAVEEQFYLVWPWIVLLLVLLVGRVRRLRRGPVDGPAPYLTGWSRLALAVVTLVLAAGSALLMARLYQPGYDPTRVYEGTDTRAFGLLIGAAVAIVWPTRRPARGGSASVADGAVAGEAIAGGAIAGGAVSGGASADRRVPTAVRWLLDVAGVAGLAVIGLLVWRTSEYSDFMFRGGLVELSAATAVTVAAVTTQGSLLGRALGCGPLRWLGVRSYGIYLWHYPVIVLTTAAGTAGAPVSPVRAVAIVAGTVVAAALSWQVIEEPIRRGARLRWVVPAKAGEPGAVQAIGEALVAGAPSGVDAPSGDGEPSGGGRGADRLRPGLLRSRQAVGVLCLLGVAVIVAGVTASMRLTSASGQSAAAQEPSTTHARLSNSAAGPVAVARHGKAAHAHAHRGAIETAATGPASPVATVPALPTPPPRTSCTAVVHIGDSTSEGLTSPDYLPNPATRITARYADVGVKTSIMKIVGATSVIESLPGTPNAYQMASQVKQGGYHGCWVLALGTNDTADVYVGSNVDRAQRIQKMMSVIGNQPVMWVEVTSLLSTGPYAEQNMRQWDQALQQLRPQYPNMRIYDWPAVAKPSWFISDGIHYTSTGYEHRAKAIANALAEAFPAS
jgi:peptidoglycan/LPS O-acetylase OafA/YrhL/lysophospholipase L1-like esterase